MTAEQPEEARPEEPVTVADRRRIDPETGEVREAPAADDPPAEADPAVDAEAESDEAVPEVADVADERVAELTADLQRERAQFANFRRRAAEEKQGSVAYGKQVLIEKLLPILDDLDRAREHGDLEGGPLKVMADKLAGALTAEGLTRFGEPGDVFDPELHEAVQHDGEGENPVLGAVYRSGYRVGDKVIRTAMVTVTDPVEPAGGDTDGGSESDTGLTESGAGEAPGSGEAPESGETGAQ